MHDLSRSTHARKTIPHFERVSAQLQRGQSMEKRQWRLEARAWEVQGFLRELPNMSPTLRAAQRRFEALVVSVRREATNQVGAQMLLPVDGMEIRQLRRALRDDHLFPVSRLAKKLLKFAPKVESALQVPHARANSTDLVDAAAALGRALKPHTKLLVAEGYLPTTFLVDLRDARKRLDERSRQIDSAMRRRTKATEAMARLFSEISEEVAILDGLLRSLIGRNRTLALKWKRAKRIPRQLGRPKAKRGLAPISVPRDSAASAS